MNVRQPYPDSRERTHAYDLQLNIQNDTLDKMTNMIRDMRVAGKTYLLPFQKGIILSNNVLKLLFEDIKQRFGVKYIMTYRLNQDVLENFFGVIRGKGGLHDHPDHQEFKFRLRSYILGFNEGAVSENGNTTIDETAVLSGHEYGLTGKILCVINVPKDISEDNEPEDLPMAYDELENLAGYICHKLKHTNPECRVDKENDTNYTWVNHLDGGGLCKPTEEMVIHIAALDAIFTEVNGDKLNLSENYLKKLIHLADEKQIDCDTEVKKIFFRTRMYFRIR